MSVPAPTQRLRLTYAQGEELQYVGHLDMLRAWERILRRAALPVAYSHGFNPRPRMVFAAPLPVGFTSAHEVIDVLLEERVDVPQAAQQVAEQLPHGLCLLSAEEVDLALPPLPNEVAAIEYEVTVRPATNPDEVRARVAALLAAADWPMTRGAPGKQRRYDLRRLIRRLDVREGTAGTLVLMMQLQAGQEGTGRPDQVLAALGPCCMAQRIHRVRLVHGRVLPTSETVGEQDDIGEEEPS